MVVQCRVCKKVRHNGRFRPAWPGELPMNISHTYCPACAKETLRTLQRGEIPFHYGTTPREAAG